ncbi:carbohydrate ABC transporter permease [Cohnella sp. 56]|uniref:carbohydrate ABC transporter permease n=1 Tax=Cohnella sp. 56 TaxID=3113722 RepID=UPI0030E9ECBE
MNAKKVYPLAFLIPSVAIYTLLFFFPSLFSFYYSMTDWNGFNDRMNFIGLANYRQLLEDTSGFMHDLKNTVVFGLATTVLKNGIGLALALLLNEGLRSRNALRTIFFVPYSLSPLIIGLIFSSIFDANHGLLNGALTAVGLESWTQGWLIDTRFAMPSVISVETWKFVGFNMIIYLAGLQMIDKAYYEAASIDGASRWAKFSHITLPLIMPAITINLVLNLINGFKVFDLIFVLTRGGPGNVTEVMNTAVFREFSAGRYGSATAIGVVLFLLTTVIALSALRLLSSRTEVE